MPQCDQNESTAVRGFAFAINNGDGIMNYSPSDFELYEVGKFDSESGKLIPNDSPVFIVAGNSVVGD